MRRGGEFTGAIFNKVCDRHVVRQDFTPPDTPKMNGVAERGLNLILEAAQAAILELPRLFPDIRIPASSYLWPEACFWAGEAFNRIATAANFDQKTSYKLFHG